MTIASTTVVPLNTAFGAGYGSPYGAGSAPTMPQANITNQQSPGVRPGLGVITPVANGTTTTTTSPDGLTQTVTNRNVGGSSYPGFGAYGHAGGWSQYGSSPSPYGVGSRFGSYGGYSQLVASGYGQQQQPSLWQRFMNWL